jgi:hypothetical protein
MPGNGHVRFGGRAEETDRPKGRHRASARSNHSYATWLAEDGVPINYAQQVLGHEKASTLLDIYTHTTKNRGRANRRILETFAPDLLPDDPDTDEDNPDDESPDPAGPGP